MSEPQDPAAPASAPRRRLVVIGVAVLIGCAAIIAAAIWTLVNPSAPRPQPTALATSTAPARDAQDDHRVVGEHDHDHDEDGSPHRHGAAEIVGEPAVEAPTLDDVQVAETWVRTLLGWTHQERDATAALARATQAAPGVQLEHLAAAVLDHAAALAAGASEVNQVHVVDVTDPTIWPAGWVVLDAAVTTSGDPEAGVPPIVLHVTCEVEVADGQVVTAVIGDGAAWIEHPA
jgi:hypothetical protein